MSSNVDLNVRPGYDSAISEIADYVSNYQIDSELALETARNCLIDTIGCGLPVSYTHLTLPTILLV